MTVDTGVTELAAPGGDALLQIVVVDLLRWKRRVSVQTLVTACDEVAFSPTTRSSLDTGATMAGGHRRYAYWFLDPGHRSLCVFAGRLMPPPYDEYIMPRSLLWVPSLGRRRPYEIP
jgi:hypothetical protein